MPTNFHMSCIHCKTERTKNVKQSRQRNKNKQTCCKWHNSINFHLRRVIRVHSNEITWTFYERATRLMTNKQLILTKIFARTNRRRVFFAEEITTVSSVFLFLKQTKFSPNHTQEENIRRYYFYFLIKIDLRFIRVVRWF